VDNIEDLITLEERQRVMPTDRAALQRAVDELRSSLDDSNVPSLVPSLRRLGSGLTALREYGEAQRVLERALELASNAGDERAAVAARINLGDAYRYAGDLQSAREHYEIALRHARASVPDLVDFALQHQGKYFIDAGRLDDAAACLREALRLREAKGDPSLVTSTRDALALTQAQR
jgi:tetratricopeptide (TPR) repeat protein